MSRLVIQISDLHLAGDRLVHGRVDCGAQLDRVFAALAEGGCRADALVLSGDLADEGDADAYRQVRAAIEPVAAELGAAVLYLPGNHDDAAVLERELLHREPTGRPLDQVAWVGGLRIVALDSTDPIGHHGTLDDAQLSWLADELATPAPEGTLLALHHPPIASPSALMNELVLRDPDRLGAVVAGSDVRLVVSGHTHHVSCGVLGGVPVWVAPSIAYVTDVLAPPGTFRAVVGGGFTRIDVTDGVPVATYVPFGDPSEPLVAGDVAELLVEASQPR